MLKVPSCLRRWGGDDRRGGDRAPSWTTKNRAKTTNLRSGRLCSCTGVEESFPKRRRIPRPIWSSWKPITTGTRPEDSWKTARWRCTLPVTCRTSPPPHFLLPYVRTYPNNHPISLSLSLSISLNGNESDVFWFDLPWWRWCLKRRGKCINVRKLSG